MIQQVLQEWAAHTLYLALDTSLLWHQYCLIRISLLYGGWAIPLVWQVLEHASGSVAYADYQALLDQAARLVPLHCTVVFLADRGFADTNLMAQLQRLKWHWRIRLKGNFSVQRRNRRPCKVNRIRLARGQARFWHPLTITAQAFGPVPLALARCPSSGEY